MSKKYLQKRQFLIAAPSGVRVCGSMYHRWPKSSTRIRPVPSPYLKLCRLVCIRLSTVFHSLSLTKIFDQNPLRPSALSGIAPSCISIRLSMMVNSLSLTKIFDQNPPSPTALFGISLSCTSIRLSRMVQSLSLTRIFDQNPALDSAEDGIVSFCSRVSMVF